MSSAESWSQPSSQPPRSGRSRGAPPVGAGILPDRGLIAPRPIRDGPSPAGLAVSAPLRSYPPTRCRAPAAGAGHMATRTNAFTASATPEPRSCSTSPGISSPLATRPASATHRACHVPSSGRYSSLRAGRGVGVAPGSSRVRNDLPHFWQLTQSPSALHFRDNAAIPAEATSDACAPSTAREPINHILLHIYGLNFFAARLV